jgi:hypothetical protein
VLKERHALAQLQGRFIDKVASLRYDLSNGTYTGNIVERRASKATA